MHTSLFFQSLLFLSRPKPTGWAERLCEAEDNLAKRALDNERAQNAEKQLAAALERIAVLTKLCEEQKEKANADKKDLAAALKRIVELTQLCEDQKDQISHTDTKRAQSVETECASPNMVITEQMCDTLDNQVCGMKKSKREVVVRECMALRTVYWVCAFCTG